MKRFTATAVALCLVGALTVGGISTATGSSGHHDDGQAAAIVAIHGLQASFHHAVSGGGHIDELAGLWAPDATFTAGGNKIVGRDAIRAFFLKGFQHPTWVSLSPSWKTRIDVHGNTANVYFECHFVDLATGALVAPGPAFAGGTFEGTARRVHGHWFFADVTAGSAPLSSAP
jgi:hypothetical protein